MDNGKMGDGRWKGGRGEMGDGDGGWSGLDVSGWDEMD